MIDVLAQLFTTPQIIVMCVILIVAVLTEWMIKAIETEHNRKIRRNQRRRR